jgi:ABC-type transporter Mla subunit MlaD
VSQLLAQYERTGAQFEQTARSLDAAVRDAKLAETTGAMRDAASAFAGLSADGSALAEDARSSLAELEETLESVRTLADYLGATQRRSCAARSRERGEPAP